MHNRLIKLTKKGKLTHFLPFVDRACCYTEGSD